MIIRSIKSIIADRSFPAIAPEASVTDACEMLARRETDALVVVDKVGGPQGILTDRDIIRRGVGRGMPLEWLTVAEIMTPTPKPLAAAMSLADALAALDESGLPVLPVVDRGRVVGLLSERDIPAKYRVMAENMSQWRHADQVTGQAPLPVHRAAALAD